MSQIHKSLMISALLIAGLLLIPQPVRADAIDGNWCHKTKRLAIDGPQIVTPGGKAMEGQYDRHGFTYVAPKQEPHGGKVMALDLIDDDNLTFAWPGATEPQVWRRCAPPTS